MFRIIFFVILFFSNYSFAVNFNGADLVAQRQYSVQDPEILNYLSERTDYENSILLDEKGNCYNFPGGQIIQIIRINKDGIVDLVVSNIENSKSKCFKSNYLGTKYKKPPKYPIYQKMWMGS
jgi:hypothetical protein